MKSHMRIMLRLCIIFIIVFSFIPVPTTYAKTIYKKTLTITNIQTKIINVYKDSKNKKIKSAKVNNKNVTISISNNKKTIKIVPEKALSGTVKLTVNLTNNKKLYYKIKFSKAKHSHKWRRNYKTVYQQQYADDGTTNDYSKPIVKYDIYYKNPIMERHIFNNGVDLTVAIKKYNEEHGTNFTYGDSCFDLDFATYLHDLGATSNRVYSQYVEVAWEPFFMCTVDDASKIEPTILNFFDGKDRRERYYSEERIDGYEKLKKKAVKSFCGYKCSVCGKKKAK